MIVLLVPSTPVTTALAGTPVPLSNAPILIPSTEASCNVLPLLARTRPNEATNVLSLIFAAAADVTALLRVIALPSIAAIFVPSGIPSPLTAMPMVRSLRSDDRLRVAEPTAAPVVPALKPVVGLTALEKTMVPSLSTDLMVVPSGKPSPVTVMPAISPGSTPTGLIESDPTCWNRAASKERTVTTLKSVTFAVTAALSLTDVAFLLVS